MAAQRPRGGEVGLRTIYDEGFLLRNYVRPRALCDCLRAPERAGTFGQTYSLAASGDLDFPSLPILFGLRLGSVMVIPGCGAQAVVVAYAVRLQPRRGRHLGHQTGPSDAEVIRRFLLFLEDRRVLYNPYGTESPGFLITQGTRAPSCRLPCWLAIRLTSERALSVCDDDGV